MAQLYFGIFSSSLHTAKTIIIARKTKTQPINSLPSPCKTSEPPGSERGIQSHKWPSKLSKPLILAYIIIESYLNMHKVRVLVFPGERPGEILSFQSFLHLVKVGVCFKLKTITMFLYKHVY